MAKKNKKVLTKEEWEYLDKLRKDKRKFAEGLIRIRKDLENIQKESRLILIAIITGMCLNIFTSALLQKLVQYNDLILLFSFIVICGFFILFFKKFDDLKDFDEYVEKGYGSGKFDKIVEQSVKFKMAAKKLSPETKKALNLREEDLN